MPSVHFSNAMSQAARAYLQAMTLDDRAELRDALIKYFDDNPVGVPPLKGIKFKASTGTFNVKYTTGPDATGNDTLITVTDVSP